MLKFNNAWRYQSPGNIPKEVSDKFYEIILRIARGKQDILEHFKSYFASAAGSTIPWSSSASWADTDLQRYMSDASDNAPIFIEAFYEACEDINKGDENGLAPDVNIINSILAKYNAGYQIDVPNLIATTEPVPISPSEIPQSVDQKARDVIQQSLSDSHRFLAEGKDRQAVQEVLWLLETVSTAFNGLTSDGNIQIEGKYFNKILEALKQNSKGTTLERVINWITTLHGYLSAPAGGGIRHGRDLKKGIATSASEAKLYCNLITSYISFLLSEYDRLKGTNTSSPSDY